MISLYPWLVPTATHRGAFKWQGKFKRGGGENSKEPKWKWSEGKNSDGLEGKNVTQRVTTVKGKGKRVWWERSKDQRRGKKLITKLVCFFFAHFTVHENTTSVSHVTGDKYLDLVTFSFSVNTAKENTVGERQWDEETGESEGRGVVGSLTMLKYERIFTPLARSHTMQFPSWPAEKRILGSKGCGSRTNTSSSWPCC